MKSRLILAAFLTLGLQLTEAQEAVPSGVDAPPVAEVPAGEPTNEKVAEAPPEKTDPSETEAVIPAAFDISRYQSTWDKNPFNLKTVAPQQTQVQWSQDWALAGMFNNKGRILISIKNKQTQEFKQVSSDSKADAEFRLIKANFHRNRNEASAVIAKGAEEAELKYDEASGGQPVTINNTMKPAGNPGQPGQPQGQPQGNVPGIQRTGQAPAQQAPAQQAIARPLPPNTNGRVFNNPALSGGVVAQPGQIPGQPNLNVPQGFNPAQNGAAPPAISRRRQLIPAPVIPAQP